MSKIWPPQNTGVFAPASCVVCCGGTEEDTFWSSQRGESGYSVCLCGMGEIPDEDGNVSTPPKMYRTHTYSGTFYVDSPWRTDRYTIAGTCIYDSTTCEHVDTTSSNWSQFNDYDHPFGDPGVDCSGGSAVQDVDSTITNRCGYAYVGSIVSLDHCSETITPTTYRVEGNGSCIDRIRAHGFLQSEFSDEDTEADAITRWLAANPAYGAYTSGDKVSAWGVRGDGEICFAYTRVKWRKRKSGLIPSGHYQVDVEIWRRVYDPSNTNPYSLYATQTETGYADGAGLLEVFGDVPQDAGFESYAKASTAVVTPI